MQKTPKTEANASLPTSYWVKPPNGSGCVCSGPLFQGMRQNGENKCHTTRRVTTNGTLCLKLYNFFCWYCLFLAKQLFAGHFDFQAQVGWLKQHFSFPKAAISVLCQEQSVIIMSLFQLLFYF